MAEQILRAESAQVIRLADYRQQKPAWPAWSSDIRYCCLYADKLRADHAAERAAIKLEELERGIQFWWEGPQDIRDRVDANNLQWELYRAVLKHLAALPASTRSEASMKRRTVGKLWLRGEGQFSEAVRQGCEADDHLFPRSLKLAKGAGREK
ncbi:hypothetical protein AAG596_12785 [Citromicrobium bathyomarinum]|uniref:hypothetical protein n=1 Tax=Citromicrobium bathyomarinum TaxID=72174 RepID=UPI003159E445